MPPRRILIIEDDPDLAILLTDTLSMKGYACKLAGDAVQGMKTAVQYRPELIVLDFMMPGGGAPTLHKALRADATVGKAPIIVLTSVAEEQVQRSLDMDGDPFYLAKPFRREELLQVIAQALLDVPPTQ